MYKGKKVIVVLPAYNAAETLEKTIAEIPDIVDELIRPSCQVAQHPTYHPTSGQ